MKYKEIIDRMTLEEKIALCSGKDFWHTKDFEKYGIPSMMMCDGPHGLRKQEDAADMLGVNASVPATAFPTAAATGCSFDTELLGKIGAAITEEAKANQVGLVLGPGANLKRNPLCGRNFEYLSEDPYLSGKLAAAFIKEAQKNGIGTSLKHFACNNQEYKRFSSDSILDARTLRELYLSAFEIAVKEGKPKTVMSSYNKINGVHSSENKELLTDILRKEWGFDGVVVTDWGGMSDRIKSFAAGCDLSMPGGSAYMEKETVEAVKKGALSEDAVNLAADRMLTLVRDAAEVLKEKTTYDKEAHHALACEAAEKSAVLLKNEEHILPLKKEEKIALIGVMAKEPRYQGAGSSHINPTKLEKLTEQMPEAIYAAGCDIRGDTTEELLAEAVKAAKEAEKVIICAGLTDSYESEGFDRENMKMPQGHIRMIEEVAKVNPNVVVVLMCGSVVEVPWADQVKGILYMGLSGQAGALAIRNLLYGEANPSGRLAETWPNRYEDCPSAAFYANGKKDAQYREGIYVGYRYYDKAGVPVRFPFGYGLSYTSFTYSTPVISKAAEGYQVQVEVTNMGAFAGGEVVQLYVGAPQDGIHRPLRELKGFQKVYLAQGESRTVTFALNDRSFAVWSDGFKVPEGSYEIFVGGTPKSLISAGTVQMEAKGENVTISDWQAGSWYEKPEGIISKEQWEKMLGHTVEEPELVKGHFSMDNTVMEMKNYSFVMKVMYKGVEASVAKGFEGKVDYSIPEFRMMMASSADCSMSSMQICSGMKGHLMEGMLAMANGHFFKGIKLMIKK